MLSFLCFVILIPILLFYGLLCEKGYLSTIAVLYFQWSISYYCTCKGSDKSQRSFLTSAFALIFSCLYSQRLKVSLTVVACNIQKLYIWKCVAINCLVWYSFLHYFMKVWHKWSFEIPRKTAKGFLLTSSISLCLRRYWRTYFPKNNNIRPLYYPFFSWVMNNGHNMQKMQFWCTISSSSLLFCILLEMDWASSAIERNEFSKLWI